MRRKTGKRRRRKSAAENKERADTERQTDMKQIRRISEVAEEPGETALIRLGKIVNHTEVQKVDSHFLLLPKKS